MGMQESKLEEECFDNNSICNKTVGTLPSTPILTPLDPRSPTVNIARTPLEVELSTKEIVEEVLTIDPRSPTTDFTRTPIVIETLSKKLQNKNLDKVLKTECQTPKTIIPPKLLNVTPVSIVTNYKKRQSFVGLLETNIDFTETDLDAVVQQKEIDDSNTTLEKEMTALNLDKKNPINVTAQVQDFDKKLSNLIYQDETDEETKTVKTVKSKDNRTPLGIRNGDEGKRSKLKVSDRPRSATSKIPVFQKFGTQCENTPPTANEGKLCKTKISRWDADKTLVI